MISSWTPTQLEKLTPSQLNIALWELDGWKACRQGTKVWAYEHEGVRRYVHEMPNYSGSHDACQQMIGSLKGDDRSLYADQLGLLCPVPLDKSPEAAWEREWFNLTASTRHKTIALILTRQTPPI